MKKEEYYDRSYNFEDIEQDPRLVRSTKEMKVTLAYYSVYMVFVILASYYMARGPAADYAYLFGLPTYLTGMVIIAFIGMIGVLILTKCLFTEEDLSPHISGALPPQDPATKAAAPPAPDTQHPAGASAEEGAQ